MTVPAPDADLIANLQASGSTGADLSPGDPTARAAADLIAKLRAENAALREVLRDLLVEDYRSIPEWTVRDRARALLEGK